jgi:hypothetical protein
MVASNSSETKITEKFQITFQNLSTIDKLIRDIKNNKNDDVRGSLYLPVRLCKSSPITGLDRLRGFQEVEAPRFLDNHHMKVVRFSAIRTGRV